MQFKKKIVCALLLLSGGVGHVSAQEKASAVEQKKMEWFDDAKLGIFIHWGIYSVQGISESWAFFNNYISHDNYMKQLDGFTASNYDPKEWAQLIKEAGAKYTVITSKHHDGVSLWDTKAPEAITTLTHTPAKKDVLTPFVEEVKKAGLHTGIYFSLPDWSHPYYDVNTRTQKRYEMKDDASRWAKFVGYYQQQLTEISTQFKPDLIWFDGDWEHSAEEWQSPQTLALLQKYNPNIIINSRLNHYGDYETPEQGVPVVKPASRYWELCYTMNDSWGYQPFDKHYKTPNMIVRTLVDCISMGGNLLLDIGPKADGSIPKEQLQILQELKRWTSKHGEAIYGTRAGLGQSMLRDKSAFSKDGKTLYVYLDHVKESVVLNSLQTKPTRVRIVGAEKDLDFNYSSAIARCRVNLPAELFDKTVTVLAFDFDEKPVFTEMVEGTFPLQEIVKFKKDKSVIGMLVDKTDKGYNLLAGKITEDGRVLDQQIEQASPAVQTWIKKHAEVLHQAEAGMPEGHYSGYSALSKDKQTLYLFVEGKPTGPIALKGLKNTIARIRIVGEGSMIGHQIFNKLYWSAIPGIVYIDVPADRLDKDYTVIAVLLDKPIELYREEVGAIESNL
ncbi:alpha-L-fucosidase [Sphingobacterium wenxiniae]|uniref:alpha-L-fucosidase n=1 Tax=Sphingobacterium wenxiniae TaxID=683125 RepID=A0A1I6Q142_9SPHI|nr:alpha-L-fucosidase [Sphingobacterium wenxiniae]SFS46187.1 alpha-L-fucosidase [Sphingobacterium wenxiniae]